MVAMVSVLLSLCLTIGFAIPSSGIDLFRFQQKAEWTVLFYMCGSNLESQYGLATESLKDISRCYRPETFDDAILDTEGKLQELFSSLSEKQINVVVETGGCRQWHTEALEMDIATDALQRWEYKFNSDGTTPGRFALRQTLPLRSMARSETLSDFIRWGAENYPAKKYALVLWDHGGGSKTGLFIDELFSNDIMQLNELSEAFRNGGIQFETVLFDACMMANLETAYAIHDYAKWMVASEELVAGKGTAVDAWLQQLSLMPLSDGERLGRWICDMTQIKYANEDSESARQLMTWSEIDLSKIERVAYYFDKLFFGLCLAYKHTPEELVTFAKATFHTELYGSGENMLDLSGVFYNSSHNSALSREMRRKMLEALMDAVVYSVRGSGRAAARGLSFCYATDFTPEELDVYAHNCPSTNYLALLDAISPWTAPEWVYKNRRRLPEMETIDAYKLKVNYVVLEDGTPGFYLDEGSDFNLGTARFTLYRKNEAKGQTVSLGTAPVFLDTEIDPRGIYHVPGLDKWPSIDGDICEIKAVSIPFDGEYNTLYNIPIQIDSDIWNLRCGYMASDNSFTIYGLWEGFDSDSTMFNRNVRELAQVAGQEYCLLYQIDEKGSGKTSYEIGSPKIMYRRLTVENVPLPVGTYYMEYVIYDVFMRPMKLKRVEMYWNGRRMSVKGGDWTGKETLSIADYYKTNK